MSAPIDDTPFRSAFHELREDDARAMPTYTAVLSRADTPRMTLTASPLRRIAAVIAVVVAAYSAYSIYTAHAKRISVPSEVVALGAWRPATDALLAAPMQLLRAPSNVRASMINVDSLTTGVLR